jgi:hypothetical protein
MKALLSATVLFLVPVPTLARANVADKLVIEAGRIITQAGPERPRSSTRSASRS